ncbi:MAG: hypothetical protein K0S18_163 [Anaerocolumna sp.]|jgi:hypothetical protein|nr:hypothetical protein [Anaerocolumna sp.]
MKKNFKRITKCPICEDELVLIDDMNYLTMICPNCHSTVFEELDNTVHVIENGIMEDGYNASLDIFYKQLTAYSIYVKNLHPVLQKQFWEEKQFVGIFENEDILAGGIYDYFIDKIKGFKMRQPCIYFEGYKKYLEMSEPIANEFYKRYL